VSNSLAVAIHGYGLEQFGKSYVLPLLVPQVLKVFKVLQVHRVRLVQLVLKVFKVLQVQFQMLLVLKVLLDQQVLKV
jgi:hypothetical protein